jgi:hypothetical protein
MLSHGLRPRLTLCMIVRDERECLPVCLRSVRGLADEIIVVDTGSADGTQAIAREYGAEVIQAEWSDDFSQARNLGLARASGAWILVLDADEVLPDASREKIRSLVKCEPFEAFHVITCSGIASGQSVRGAAVRLFPNQPEVRFRFPLHEEVNGNLMRAGIPLRASDIEIVHTGYTDETIVARKRLRNREIIDRALAKSPAPDEAIRLRFYSGNLFRDERRWARAAVDYAWCLAQPAEASAPMNEAVRLLAAECYFELGEWDNAQAAVAALADCCRHPARLALGAELALGAGDTVAAKASFEALLVLPDTAYIPPVALDELKDRARAFLEG